MSKTEPKKIFWLGLGLIIGLTTCTPRYTIKITTDAQINLPPNQTIQVFLLNAEAHSNFEQIRAYNSSTFSRAAYRLQDSLRTLYRQYVFAAVDKARYESKFQSHLENYRQNILKAQRAECLQVLRVSNLWQLRLKISNQSAEEVKGVTLSIYFNKIPLVQSQSFPISIIPYSSATLNNVYVDLTENNRLQYSLATYPGGLDKLAGALKLVIESIDSDCAQFMKEYQLQAQNLAHAELEAALLIEDYSSNQITAELQRIAKPLNKILVNNLLTNALIAANLSPGDTLTFADQRQGEYYLVAFANPEDALQWLTPINLSQDYLLLLRPTTCNPFFIQVTPETINRLTNIISDLSSTPESIEKGE